MSSTKTFKSYNFMTGAVDGTLAYDFGNPALNAEEELAAPPRHRPEPRRQEWIREDEYSDAAALPESGTKLRLLPALNLVLGVAAAVLMLLLLLSQIQLTDISSRAVALEDQIETLRAEQSVLRVEYEAVFNLKDVKEYAVNVLGMQEPCEDQIVYLSGVTAADQAVVITRESTSMFSMGMEDIISSVKTNLHISG